MDCNPVLFFKGSPVEGHFITPTLGPYDYWAIEYGYRPYEAKSADKKMKKENPKSGDEASYLSLLSAEERMLQEIACRAAEPELLYATDEDTMWIFSPDPRSNRFDMGSDPIEWARSRVELVDDRIDKILDWGAKDGESWYHARSAFVRLLFEKMLVFDYVGRYTGGQYFHRSHRADPNAGAPFELVDAKLQRKALNFIVENLFEDEFFRFSPKLLNYLAPSRWWHEGVYIDMNFFMMDFPIHDYIRFMQWWHLADRLFPYTLRRIHDAEMKTLDPEKLTVAEYLQKIQGACWKETSDVARAKSQKWSDAEPFASDIRRSLQREYLDMMERLVRSRPGGLLSPDLHAMVWCSLKELGESLEEVLDKSELDFASRAHLKTCKSRIDRMLAPELEEWGR